MKELIIVGKRTVYIKCLKVFLLKEIYKNRHVLYFKSIKNVLNIKQKMNNTVVFVFEDVFNLEDFIQLCVVYGSENIKIVTYNKEHISCYGMQKKYKIEDFIISIGYNHRDCFIETLVCLNDEGRKKVLKVEDIYYIERYYGRIYFYTSHGCYDEKMKSNSQYDTILKDFQFIKIKKGCYVNIKHIRDIRNNVIVLNNNMILFLSKDMRQEYVQLN